MTQQKPPPRLPLWQAVLLPVVSVLVFFLLLEGGLALFGVSPVLKTEDPFVGFAANVPLYVPDPDAARGIDGHRPNKLRYFNQQSFPREKDPETYRIFTLGGSTTYGRPYSDTTSFAGWLRELLPLVDASRKWEVINAGGISYASYRVAHLMEELVRYQPDLFIVYTGHNEFLEERTYGEIREMPAAIRSTVALLSRTRTWSAMNTAMQSLGVAPQTNNASHDQLSGEVNAILDRSAGLERYTRDDALQAKIFEHYRISLERMAALARSVGAADHLRHPRLQSERLRAVQKRAYGRPRRRVPAAFRAVAGPAKAALDRTEVGGGPRFPESARSAWIRAMPSCSTAAGRPCSPWGGLRRPARPCAGRATRMSALCGH